MIDRFERGFSAVELLITLFIASVFLLAGYQLWGYTQKSGAESDQMAKASNLAYEYLRKYTASTSSCSPSSPSVSPQPTRDGLTNVTVNIAITCPYGNTSVSKISSTVSYSANPTKQVTHAIFTN